MRTTECSPASVSRHRLCLQNSDGTGRYIFQTTRTATSQLQSCLFCALQEDAKLYSKQSSTHAQRGMRAAESKAEGLCISQLAT